MDYSIVIPVYNSAKTLGDLHRRIAAVMNGNGYAYEVVFVNDCSTDSSLHVLKSISELDRKVSVIAMARNVGQNMATLCGIGQAKFDTVITMDDDLQYAPEDIPKLAALFDTGRYTIVYGEPLSASDDVKFKKLPAMARWMFDHVFLRSHRGVQYFRSFRIFSKSKIKKAMPDGPNVYYVWDIPAAQMTQLKVHHHTSLRGQSNYNMARLIRFFAIYIYFVLMRLCGALILFSISVLLSGAIAAAFAVPVYKNFFKSFFCVFILSIIFYFLFKLLVAKRRRIDCDYRKI